jgi:hypothetical protein
MRTITLHTRTTPEGGRIQYAMVIAGPGSQVLGQKVLLCRLSKDERAELFHKLSHKTVPQ